MPYGRIYSVSHKFPEISATHPADGSDHLNNAHPADGSESRPYLKNA
jgi:hypothetical protein